MNHAQRVITRFQRQLAMTMLLRVLLLGAAVVVLIGGSILSGRLWDVMLAVVLVSWLVLSYRAVQTSRAAAHLPALIASGRYEQAENLIDQGLRGFSLFRSVKLLGLHHLALLRHAQGRWAEAAALCRAFLHQRLGALAPLSAETRLMLCESLLELNDLPAVHQVLMSLWNQRLTLGQAINLLRFNVEYLARVGAWEQILREAPTRVQLADLMGSEHAARVLALMALAARRTGRSDWEQYLRTRAELIGHVPELRSARPALAELWPNP